MLVFQSDVFSISLDNGTVVMEVKKIKVMSADHHYNDGLPHFVITSVSPTRYSSSFPVLPSRIFISRCASVKTTVAPRLCCCFSSVPKVMEGTAYLLHKKRCYSFSRDTKETIRKLLNQYRHFGWGGRVNKKTRFHLCAGSAHQGFGE